MRAASLFSGIGCPEVACPELDWRFVAEIDPFASAVLAHRFPGVPNLGDVDAPGFVERAREHGPVDLLVFGTPCQSFSVAGRRLGLGDPRGNLALAALRVASELRPRWICFENVPGLLSSAKGWDFGAFLRGVEDSGYLGCWRVLDAQHAGVPQRRRRVFFVGHLGDWRPAAAVLFEPESLRGDTAPGREAGEGVAGTVAASAPSRRNAGSDPVAGHLIARPLAACPEGGSGYRNDADTADNLIAETVGPICSCGGTDRKHGHGMGQQDWESGYAVPQPYTLAIRGRGDSHDLECRQDGTANAILTPNGGRAGIGCGAVAIAENQRHELREMDVVPSLNNGGGKPGRGYPAIAFHARQDPDSADVTHPLDTDGFSNAVAFHTSGYGAQVDDVSQTLQASDARLSNQVADVIDCMAVRRLTPRECERLQGLPDDWTLVPYRGKAAADGPRYRAVGNGMAVPVIRWILRRIVEYERAEAA